MTTISITEAKNIAIAKSFKEAMWLKGLVGEICRKMSLVDVHCDSENAIHLARNQNTFHGRTKHIDISTISSEMKLKQEVGFGELPKITFPI